MKQEDEKLFEAISITPLDRARSAINAGANVNALGQWQQTPLHYAAMADDADIARLLIEKGADVNALDKGQHTPLHWAAIRGHINVARLLIENGADVNARDDQQKTPLDWAIFEAKAPDIIALLEAAAVKSTGHADRVAERRDADEKRQR
jgi:ankyrin repeat protein